MRVLPLLLVALLVAGCGGSRKAAEPQALTAKAILEQACSDALALFRDVPEGRVPDAGDAFGWASKLAPIARRAGRRLQDAGEPLFAEQADGLDESLVAVQDVSYGAPGRADRLVDRLEARVDEFAEASQAAGATTCARMDPDQIEYVRFYFFTGKLADLRDTVEDSLAIAPDDGDAQRLRRDGRRALEIVAGTSAPPAARPLRARLRASVADLYRALLAARRDGRRLSPRSPEVRAFYAALTAIDRALGIGDEDDDQSV